MFLTASVYVTNEMYLFIYMFIYFPNLVRRSSENNMVYSVQSTFLIKVSRNQFVNKCVNYYYHIIKCCCIAGLVSIN